MLSKLIDHGSSREEAIKKLEDAITKFEIDGVNTTLAYGRFAITHPAFLSGQFDTHFVEKYKEEFLLSEAKANKAAARFAMWLYNKRRRVLVLPKMDDWAP